jgi:hypothetical protein
MKLACVLILIFFTAPLLAQDIHCTQIANTTNCVSGPQAAAANAGAAIGQAAAEIGGAIAQSLAMRKLRKDAEVNSATAVAFCQQNLDETGCGYTLAFIQAYCTVYDPSLYRLRECKQMSSSFERPDITPAGAFVASHEGPILNPHDVNANLDAKAWFDTAARVLFCQKYPDSVVYAPKDVIGTKETGEINEDVPMTTCAFEIKYVNARCTVVDPQYTQQLACSLLRFFGLALLTTSSEPATARPVTPTPLVPAPESIKKECNKAKGNVAQLSSPGRSISYICVGNRGQTLFER